jgi:hypothetical protein
VLVVGLRSPRVTACAKQADKNIASRTVWVGGLTVRARVGRLSGPSVSHRKFSLYGAFLWARGRLTAQNGGLRPGQEELGDETFLAEAFSKFGVVQSVTVRSKVSTALT